MKLREMAKRYNLVAAGIALALIVVVVITNRALFPLTEVCRDASVEEIWGKTLGARGGSMTFWIGCDAHWCYADARTCLLRGDGGLSRDVILRVSRGQFEHALPSLLRSAREDVASNPADLAQELPAVLECELPADAPRLEDFSRCYERALIAGRPEFSTPAEHEAAFALAWRRTQVFDNLWRQRTFEAAWLTMLILFIAWPFIIRSGHGRVALHLGATPTLALAPLWFGYQPSLYVMPEGGGLFSLLAGFIPPVQHRIFDPMIIMSIRGVLSELGFQEFSVTPDDTVFPGPWIAFKYGVCVAVLVLMLGRWRAGRKQGLASPTSETPRHVA